MARTNQEAVTAFGEVLRSANVFGPIIPKIIG